MPCHPTTAVTVFIIYCCVFVLSHSLTLLPLRYVIGYVIFVRSNLLSRNYWGFAALSVDEQQMGANLGLPWLDPPSNSCSAYAALNLLHGCQMGQVEVQMVLLHCSANADLVAFFKAPILACLNIDKLINSIAPQPEI